MATVSINSNEGKLISSSAVLEVAATNPEYNQPVLRIKQVSDCGGAASIRIDDPNPDIEFVETDRVGTDPNDLGAGKYEIAVQSDKLQINGRKADGEAFETFVIFIRPGLDGDPSRPGSGGNAGFGTKDQFGGGRGVIAIANVCVLPSTNPAEGGILYVEEGALKYRGPQGTVTTLASA